MANGDFTKKFSLNGTTTDGTSKDFSPSTETVSGITANYDQIMAIPNATVATIFQVAAADAGGTFTEFDELWLHNMDSSISIKVKVVKDTASSFAFTLPAGKIVSIPTTMLGDATGSPASIGTPVAFTHVVAQAVSGTPKLRIFALKS